MSYQAQEPDFKRCAEKLAQLLEDKDFDGVEEMVADAIENDECYGICMTRDCSIMQYVERDQSGAWCEHCENASIMSGEILMRLV